MEGEKQRQAFHVRHVDGILYVGRAITSEELGKILSDAWKAKSITFGELLTTTFRASLHIGRFGAAWVTRQGELIDPRGKLLEIDPDVPPDVLSSVERSA